MMIIKNTYIIETYYPFSTIAIFNQHTAVPVQVVRRNGVKLSDTENNPRFQTSIISLPNPGATEMLELNAEFTKKLGEETASKVIEYLDKQTLQPVALLYPHRLHPLCPNYMDRMNHASRQHLAHQMKIRNVLIQKFNKINGK